MFCSIVESKSINKYSIVIKDEKSQVAMTAEATFINGKYQGCEKKYRVGSGYHGLQEWEIINLLSSAILTLRDRHKSNNLELYDVGNYRGAI